MGETWQMVGAIAGLCAFGLSLYTLLTARNREDVAELMTAKVDHGNRLAKLETTVEHMPGTEAVHELQLSISDMKGQLAVIVERVGPIKAIAERLQENYLEHGK